MTDHLAFPPVRSVRGTVAAPPSKSATNRALVLAALSQEPVEIVRPLDSEDTSDLAGCLAAMGAVFRPTAGGFSVHGPLGTRVGREPVILDAGASGTAARFLAAIASAVPGNYRLTGRGRLGERPFAPLVAALREAGADVAYAGPEGFLPLAIRGGTLRAPGRGAPLSVDASQSSQFLSALLLAAAARDEAFSVRPLGPVVSAPYVEATVAALRAFGHGVASGDDGTVTVTRGDRPPSRFEVPGDWSSALPFLTAAGVAGGEVTVTGLEWPSADADARALDAIEAMGVTVERSPRAIRARGDGAPPEPVDVAAGDFPDAVPALAALAVFAEGESRFRSIAHLKWKESDRLAATADLLRAAGAVAKPGEGELAVTGPPRRQEGLRRLPTCRDHRIAMAAALLALRLPGSLVQDPGCVAKSYPAFFRDLETILIRG